LLDCSFITADILLKLSLGQEFWPGDVGCQLVLDEISVF